jgi:hypothetical protein
MVEAANEGQQEKELYKDAKPEDEKKAEKKPILGGKVKI